MDSSDDFQIIVPGPEHAEAVAAVHPAAWREAYEGLVPASALGPAMLERRRAHWRAQLSKPPPDQVTRIAVAGGAVLGLAVAGPPQDGHDPEPEWELQAIYTRQDRYGTGVGQGLLEATLGERPAQVWVLRDNSRAVAFYRRNGFRPDGSEIVLERLGGLVEIRMVR